MTIGTGSITIKNTFSYSKTSQNNFIVRTKNSDGSYHYDRYYYGTKYNLIDSSSTDKNGTSENDWMNLYASDTTINSAMIG